MNPAATELGSGNELDLPRPAGGIAVRDGMGLGSPLTPYNRRKTESHGPEATRLLPIGSP